MAVDVNTSEPIRLVNFRAYNSSNLIIGTTDLTLPKIEYMTETVKGSGIAGEVDLPTLGHTGSITVTINWRAATEQAAELAEQKTHEMDFRGSVQYYDSASDEYKTIPARVSLRTTPKSFEIGKFEPSATMDQTEEYEVVYLKYTLNGVDKIEIDKFNFVCKINGKDYLEGVRADIGM